MIIKNIHLIIYDQILEIKYLDKKKYDITENEKEHSII